MTAGGLRKILMVSLPVGIAAVLVVTAAVEVWVRASWVPRKGTPGFFLTDAARGQRLAPNYTGWFAGVPVHINNQGLRDDREYDLSARPNTFRILVLGDSVTFGHGSVWEHSYPYLLEQRLKARRPDVDWQVWNAAVPGYNTSQELAHLLDVGPRFRPDLVIVGFYENDLIDNRPVQPPGAIRIAVADAVSFARRHLYSLELYKRVYRSLAWKLSASNEYRRRLEHLATEESLIEHRQDVSGLPQQALTHFERLTDDQVRAANCVYGMKANPESIRAIQSAAGFGAWLDAVRGFQRLHAAGEYKIVFFLNQAPPVCRESDIFYDGGSKAINDFYVSVMANGTAAVSTYDAFLHVRPSQMPNAAAHSIGNTNLVKADTLFGFFHDHVLPDAVAAFERQPVTAFHTR